MNRFECLVCLYKSKWEFAIKEHINTFHNISLFSELFSCATIIKDFKCFLCDFQTSIRKKLCKHLRRGKHIKSLQKLGDLSLNNNFNLDQYVCTECPYTTTRRSNFNKHLKRQHSQNDQIYSCMLCPYTSRQSGNLRRHTKAKHMQAEKSYECKVCPYRTGISSYLIDHMRRNHNPNFIPKYFCPDCPYTAKLSGNLQRHIMNHHTPDEKIQWLDCPYCDYKTKTKASVNIHIRRMHQAENMHEIFKCPHCPEYTARFKRDLALHMQRKHTPEDQVKWFCCTQCPYKSKTKHDLKVHTFLKHNPNPTEGVKWFRCKNKKCKYKTFRLDHLNGHMLKKHMIPIQIPPLERVFLSGNHILAPEQNVPSDARTTSSDPSPISITQAYPGAELPSKVCGGSITSEELSSAMRKGYTADVLSSTSIYQNCTSGAEKSSSFFKEYNNQDAGTLSYYLDT